MARVSDAIPNLRLQEHRRRLDLTQEQVAEELGRLAWEHFGVRVGVDGQMVSKWERGEKRPSRFYRKLLCLLYSTTEEQLGLRMLEVVSPAEDGYDRLEPPVDASEDDLKRRELLHTAATLGAAVMLPDWLGRLAPRRAGEPPEIAAVRDALMRYDSLTIHSDGTGEPMPLPVLRHRVDQAWAAFQTSRYSILGPQLPQLLAASQLAARELDGDAKLRASGLLAETYQLAAILMHKLGESNAAWVAADRGILAAERAEDPLVVAAGARILAYAVLGAGHFAKAKELTISAAGVLEPGLGRATPSHLSLYGALLLKGAMAAAYQGDPITSRALLNEAGGTARRLGADANHAFTAFGPTNVGVHRVSAAVTLGDGGAAIQHAKAVHPVQLPVVERRAQYLVDVARGHGQTGGDDQALRALLTAEQLAPEEVRYQPPGRWWLSCCIGSGQAGSGSCAPWPSGSAPSPDASRTRQASWGAVSDCLRCPTGPRFRPLGAARPGRGLGGVRDRHPSARSFIDGPALEAATGHPIRSQYKQPDEADVLPPPDAIVVAPATFNTINKWAAEISDTLALGLLTEAIGKRLPMVALPFINAAQAEHPAFQGSVDRLRAVGVQLLYGPDVLELHEPGTGSQRVALFPWQLTLEALNAIHATRPSHKLDREAR